MQPAISHDRKDESPEAKAKWFASLSEQDRMEYLDEMSEFLLQVNPNLLTHRNSRNPKDAYPSAVRVRVVARP